MKETNKPNKKQMILWTIIVIVGLIIAAYFRLRSASDQKPGTTTQSPFELETVTTAEGEKESPPPSLETETSKADPSSTTASETTEAPTTEAPTTASAYVYENQQYSDRDHVAAYINEFGHLPSNYISKSKADNMNGWQKNGYYIGGNRFGNYEGILPKKSGRTYYECDVDYSNNNIKKGNRGTKRIVYSNDGLIFYTEDHYEHFTQLYP